MILYVFRAKKTGEHVGNCPKRQSISETDTIAEEEDDEKDHQKMAFHRQNEVYENKKKREGAGNRWCCGSWWRWGQK